MEKAFLAYVKTYEAKADPRTVSHLKWTLEGFRRFLNAEGVSHLSDLTPDLLFRFFARKTEATRPATVAVYRWAVRGLLAFLTREGYLLVNPWPDALRIKTPRPSPRQIPRPAQVLRLMQNPEACLKSHAMRNRAMLELAYGSGLRRGELMRLTLSDLRGDHLRIRGKGGKERLAPLGEKARDHLLRYLNTERPRFAAKGHPGEEAVFLGRRGKPLGRGAFDWLIKRYKQKGKPFGLHLLRHACATHMLEGGASLSLLQKLLGHERMDTTTIYTQVSLKELKSVLSRCHPRK